MWSTPLLTVLLGIDKYCNWIYGDPGGRFIDMLRCRRVEHACFRWMLASCRALVGFRAAWSDVFQLGTGNPITAIALPSYSAIYIYIYIYSRNLHVQRVANCIVTAVSHVYRIHLIWLELNNSGAEIYNQSVRTEYHDSDVRINFSIFHYSVFICSEIYSWSAQHNGLN